MAQLGSALDWGSSGRRFKSCQPDTQLQVTGGSGEIRGRFFRPCAVPVLVFRLTFSCLSASPDVPSITAVATATDRQTGH